MEYIFHKKWSASPYLRLVNDTRDANWHNRVTENACSTPEKREKPGNNALHVGMD